MPHTDEASQGQPVRGVPTTQASRLGRVISTNTGGEHSFMPTRNSLSYEGGSLLRQSIRNSTPNPVLFPATKVRSSQLPTDEARGRSTDMRPPHADKPNPPILSRHPSTDDHFYSSSINSRQLSLDRSIRGSRGSLSSHSSQRSNSIGPITYPVGHDPSSTTKASMPLQRRGSSGTPRTAIGRHPSVGHNMLLSAVASEEQRRSTPLQPGIGSVHTNPRPIGTALVVTINLLYL